MQVFLYNTLSRKKEEFHSILPGQVSMYTCGPTVYHFAHIGNLRTYIFEDILKRTLTQAGYTVNHVMNITDVGHLQSDADDGEDKMNIASVREQKTPWEIARFYEDKFVEDCHRLSIIPPTTMPRATEHVSEMINFVSCLECKHATYAVDGNVYFDTSTFKNYGKLARLKPSDVANAQSRVEQDPRKRNQNDFVLWFSSSKYPNQVMKWESQWGIGYPGWHIECSAMARRYLGEHIDIHCGGQDHINIHHTNEIAQTEMVTGKKWVNFWMHGAFLEDQDGKMSKSKGAFYTLSSLTDLGFEPVHFRYFCLQGHYRKPLKFSMSLLNKAKNDFDVIKMGIISLKFADSQFDYSAHHENSTRSSEYRNNYWDLVGDDLNTADALKLVKTLIKDNKLSPRERLTLLNEFDNVLGIGFNRFSQPDLTKRQRVLLDMRNKFRQQQRFDSADVIRNAFADKGIALYDRSSSETICVQNRVDFQFESNSTASSCTNGTLMTSTLISVTRETSASLSRESSASLSEQVTRQTFFGNLTSSSAKAALASRSSSPKICGEDFVQETTPSTY